MIVQALDLTTDVGSLALLRDAAVLAERMLESTDGFGHLVFDQIRELLAAARVELADVDCFASASGPGSFTGVRVGLAVAKGLAEASGKAAVGVSNLRALAACGTGGLRVPVIDARRNEVYAAVFDEAGSATVEECVGPLGRFLEQVAGCDVEFVTRQADWLRRLLADTGYKQGHIHEAPAALSAAIGRCAWRDIAAGTSGDPALLDANYVRRSDAELFWRGPERP